MPYYLIVRRKKTANDVSCKEAANLIESQLNAFSFIIPASARVQKVVSLENCTISLSFDTRPPSTARKFNYPQVVEKHFEVFPNVEFSVVLHENTLRKDVLWRSLVGQ